MADHKVEITRIPKLLVGNSDVIFDIKADEGLLGRLQVSRGHIVWRPANNQFGYWLNWGDFDKVSRDNGRRRKVNF